MTESTKLKIVSFLLYLCIPLIIDGAYFWGFGDSQPSCGPISIAFFNISFVCLFLPGLFHGKRDEKNQKSALNIICVTYLIAETLLAISFIYKDSETTTAGITQMIVCGIFLVCFLGMARANVHTIRAIQQTRSTRSTALVEATVTLRQALTDTRDQADRELIREALTEVSTLPLKYVPDIENLDNEILSLAKEISDAPMEETMRMFSRVIHRRRTVTMLIQQ